MSLQDIADRVADQLDADVIHYNGPIVRHQDRFLIEQCIERRRRENVLLMLVTTGGDPDAAFRIARCLQMKYERFILYVSGCCKSAGTIIATGAHELIMSDHGELGPLDVQMSKKDELWERQSVLTVMDTVTALQEKAFMAFEDFFLQFKAKSGDSVTLRTATHMATEMATGLFSPLYRQIDPLHIGEAARTISIASEYGARLLDEGQNIRQDALKYLISGFPSHGFVVDRQEASNLFLEVREPTPLEAELAAALGVRSRWPATNSPRGQRCFDFLSTEAKENLETHQDDQLGGINDEDTEHAEGSDSGRNAQETPGELETGDVQEFEFEQASV